MKQRIYLFNEDRTFKKLFAYSTDLNGTMQKLRSEIQIKIKKKLGTTQFVFYNQDLKLVTPQSECSYLVASIYEAPTIIIKLLQGKGKYMYMYYGITSFYAKYRVLDSLHSCILLKGLEILMFWFLEKELSGWMLCPCGNAGKQECNCMRQLYCTRFCQQNSGNHSQTCNTLNKISRKIVKEDENVTS